MVSEGSKGPRARKRKPATERAEWLGGGRGMASMMRMCAGLVGPKRENVDFPLLFQWFLKDQKGHEGEKENLQPSGRSGWEGVGGG